MTADELRAIRVELATWEELPRSEAAPIGSLSHLIANHRVLLAEVDRLQDRERALNQEVTNLRGFPLAEKPPIGKHTGPSLAAKIGRFNGGRE